MKAIGLVAATLLAGAAPAVAAPLELSGKVEGRVGYGTNPFVRFGADKAAAFVGGTIAPVLKYQRATGMTTLSGLYDRDQYAKLYGNPDTASVRLQQEEKLRSNLDLTASLAYISSVSPIGNGTIDPTIDPLAIGTRSHKIEANGGLTWRPTERDTLAVTGGYQHGSYKRSSGLSSYDFYNASASYLHQVNARTQIGARMGYSQTRSGSFPSVQSYEPGVVLVERFSAIWVLNANLGVSFRKTPGLSESSKGLGFSASLCGTYPLTSICATADRVTSASGFGGARINSDFAIRITQKLTQADTLHFEATYTDSKSIALIGGRAQQVTQMVGSYDHLLNDRWSVGLDGRYQSRSQDLVGSAHSVGGSVHIRYLIGHLS